MGFLPLLMRLHASVDGKRLATRLNSLVVRLELLGRRLWSLGGRLWSLGGRLWSLGRRLWSLATRVTRFVVRAELIGLMSSRIATRSAGRKMKSRDF